MAAGGTTGMGQRWPLPRIAVNAAYLQAGFIIGSWAAKIPEFAAHVGIAEGGLGLLIFVFGIGSLIAMPLAGAWVTRVGPRPALVTGSWLGGLMLPALTLVPDPLAAAAVMFVCGTVVGLSEVAINTAAVETEKGMGRTIMSSCHGFWSLGGFFGATAGGWLIASLGVWPHALISGAVVFALAFVIAGWRLNEAGDHASGEEGRVRGWPITPLPYLIGLLGLIAYVVEGAMLDWSALFLRQERGFPVAMSGYAFGAFSFAMAALRFVGDPLRSRYGLWFVLTLGSVVAGSGLLLFSLPAEPILILLGCLLVGIGLSNLTPILFVIAAAIPGVPAGTGIAILSTLGFSGVLLAPSAIGFLASWAGLSAVLNWLPIMLLLFIAMLAGLRRQIRLAPLSSSA